jgi:catechol 2,3-dioxygenase-like lactoylglutathione lyase family enzyme
MNRISPLGSARTALVLIGLVFACLTASSQQGQGVVTRVDAIGMTVGDMDRAIDFYANVLTFEKVSDVEVWGEAYEHLQGLFGLRMRVVRMRLGDEAIELTEYLAPVGRPYPFDTKSNDHWFQHIAIVVRDMDKAYERLRKFKVRHASTGPQRIPDWNKGAAGIRAFYFRDPDGHYLEVIYFAEGKGDPKWQHQDERLFLGIDHTAIVVSNTETSLKFYRDVLGLRVAGESENYGTEQEHLNNVFGARLRISGLRASQGPGIEFLEYLAPSGGRPTPSDIQSNDLAHWQTRLVASDVDTGWKLLRQSSGKCVSPGPVTLPEAALGFTKGFLVRDPDGHALMLTRR